MYFKYLRYLAFALGGLCTVVAAGALFLYATFDGARLAAELSHFAKQRHQRSLRLEGPLELSMFPRLVLHVPRGSLSGRAGEGEFLGFERASLGVRLMPLLAHRVLVDRVELDGLRVALRRDRDGRHNAADLLAPPAADNGKGAEPLAFESASLAVRNGALTWNDEVTGRALALSELELSTGRLAPQAEGYAELSGRLTQASPGVDARIKLEASYRLGAEGLQHAPQAVVPAVAALQPEAPAPQGQVLVVVQHQEPRRIEARGDRFRAELAGEVHPGTRHEGQEGLRKTVERAVAEGVDASGPGTVLGHPALEDVLLGETVQNSLFKAGIHAGHFFEGAELHLDRDFRGHSYDGICQVILSLGIGIGKTLQGGLE